ncbi:MAG: hypothetical protein ISS36_01760 [Candidatus Aenigmarchaeota archaeon]|nr:hypothetical protein [Candidatus Aenigmarchaeota archaeon]
MTSEKPAERECNEWIKLPSGLYVSPELRLYRNNEMFILSHATNMDAETFNKEAEEYGIHMKESDFPLQKLIKYSILLSRKEANSSFVPLNEQYVDVVLDIAAAKTRAKARETEQPTEDEKAAISLYEKLISGPWDAAAEILEFQEKVKEGKWLAVRYPFDERGELVQEDEVVIASPGWTRAIGARHKYPIEVSEEEGPVENIENPNLEGNDVKGYSYLGDEPEKEEQRLVLRDPGWGGVGVLLVDFRGRRSCSDAPVSALRLRSVMSEDYESETSKLKVEVGRMANELVSIKKTISDAEERLNTLKE